RADRGDHHPRGAEHSHQHSGQGEPGGDRLPQGGAAGGSLIAMAHRFSQLMFTPAVKALQTRHGSREAYRRFEAPETPAYDVLGEREAGFIAARDSFYMATVSEAGWPYVQHRGGPAGFLKVLDERTIGFADFRGNRQYVSTG